MQDTSENFQQVRLHTAAFIIQHSDMPCSCCAACRNRLGFCLRIPHSAGSLHTSPDRMPGLRPGPEDPPSQASAATQAGPRPCSTEALAHKFCFHSQIRMLMMLVSWCYKLLELLWSPHVRVCKARVANVASTTADAYDACLLVPQTSPTTVCVKRSVANAALVAGGTVILMMLSSLFWVLQAPPITAFVHIASEGDAHGCWPLGLLVLQKHV